jgi:UDP-N-acetylglucosamine 1-carboxyvinyltransferase
MRRLGAAVEDAHGRLTCQAPEGLLGADIALSLPSVGATENILMAAATARGVTTLTNAAREPEIVDLAAFLNACGAKIAGAGESVVTIEGVPRLHGAVHRVIPDRIMTATYLAAAAVTGGDLTLERCNPLHLTSVLRVFEESGCTLCVKKNSLRLTAPARLAPMGAVHTTPYPGFPTDAQAAVMTMAALADGATVLVEKMFESRFKHAVELGRMGARVRTEGPVAVVEGVPSLLGARVTATDLRGGAALVVAGLAAQGETTVLAPHHIDRGWEAPEENLRRLGADIFRRVA